MVGALCIRSRADGVAHSVSGGHERGAFRGSGHLLQAARPLDLDARNGDRAAVLHQEGLLGRGRREQSVGRLARRLVDERVAFALVLTPEIDDEAGEEQEEHVDSDEGEVEVVWDGAGLHWRTSTG